MDSPAFSRNGGNGFSVDLFTAAVSPDVSAVARKSHSTALQRLASVGQAALADQVRVHESTISRWKSEQLEASIAYLAALGLKVVPASHRCFNPEQVAAILFFARERMAQLQSPEHLDWEE